MLESHQPTAIIVDGSFLPHALEPIYELKESLHHFVVVVGEADKTVLSKASKHVKIVFWADIEAHGKAVAPITPPAPGSRHLPVQIRLHSRALVQAQMMSLRSLSTETPMIKCGLCS